MTCPKCRTLKNQSKKSLDKYQRALTLLMKDITKGLDRFNERIDKIDGLRDKKEE